MMNVFSLGKAAILTLFSVVAIELAGAEIIVALPLFLFFLGFNGLNSCSVLDIDKLYHPRKDVPSFMYSFRWNGVPGMSMQAEIFDRKYKKSQEVQLGYFQDEKITASTLGFLMTGVGSSQ